MKVLGISCGRPSDNAEIMVKEALMGAEETGAEVGLVRLQDLYLKPCEGCNACVVDLFEKGGSGRCVLTDDDLPFIEEQIMECDGLILSTPAWEKSIPGQLKTLADRMGSSHDVGFRFTARQWREEKGLTAGEGPDVRSFKPRTGALMAVSAGDWDTLALPMMHVFVLLLQIDVVDKFLVEWVGLPKVIALRDDLLQRARRSGRHVVESHRKPPKDREYIGDPGLCPVCHSKVLDLSGDGSVYPTVCAVCGVRGTVGTEGGRIGFSVTDDDRRRSRALLSGKLEYLEELRAVSLRRPAGMDSLAEKMAGYEQYLQRDSAV